MQRNLRMGTFGGRRAQSTLRAAGQAATQRAPTQAESEAATQEHWATAATGATHETGETLRALIDGQYGAEAARLAAEGRTQAALLAAQSHTEDNAIEHERLALASRELALREQAAANAGTSGNVTLADTAGGATGLAAVPTWGWVAGGVAAVLAVGGITAAVMMRGKSKRSGRKGTKNPCPNCR